MMIGNANKLIDAKTILKGIGLVFSGIGLLAQFGSMMVNNKADSLEMKETVTKEVAKEVARQLAIPMKRDQ